MKAPANMLLVACKQLPLLNDLFSTFVGTFKVYSCCDTTGCGMPPTDSGKTDTDRATHLAGNTDTDPPPTDADVQITGTAGTNPPDTDAAVQTTGTVDTHCLGDTTLTTG